MATTSVYHSCRVPSSSAVVVLTSGGGLHIMLISLLNLARPQSHLRCTCAVTAYASSITGSPGVSP